MAITRKRKPTEKTSIIPEVKVSVPMPPVNPPKMALTPHQQKFFDEFDAALQDDRSLLIPVSKFDRGNGKTTLLNELAFTYQALGYEVILFNKVEYPFPFYATKKAKSADDPILRGMSMSAKYIAIIENFHADSKELEEICTMLVAFRIPYVGFKETV